MWKRRLILLVALLALIASACGTDDRDVLAVVNGEEITVDQFELAITASRSFSGTGGPIRFDGPEGRNIVTNLIAFAAIRPPLAAAGIEFPELTGSAVGTEQEFVSLALNQMADFLLGIEGPEDEADVAAIELAAMAPLDRPTCASHILLPTVEDSEVVLERLDAGETFEDLAIELSTDPGSGANGGSLGCAAPSQYVPEFSLALVALEVGQVSEPVESQFGSHLILRTADTPDVNITALLGARNVAIGTWITSTFEAADVELDPVVGEWTGTGIRPLPSS